MRPREYLSYSQKNTWKRSPKAYIEKYLYDKPQYITREMAFGKTMSLALEEERESDHLILNEVMEKLPKLDKPEMEIRSELRIGKEIIPLYSKLDTAKIDLTAFKDYKTGKTKWTQRMVDEDPQLTFYATSIWILTQRIPGDISLVWVPTVNDPDNPAGISPTGEIIEFRTHRSMGQIITEMADMRKVWKEIGEACERELI